MPWSGAQLSYFLLVIKAQTTVHMIDLVHWSTKYIIKRLGPGDISRHWLKPEQNDLTKPELGNVNSLHIGQWIDPPFSDHKSAHDAQKERRWDF